MKKLLLIGLFILLLVPSIVLGQTWHNANQATIGWSAITYPVEATERITYRLYLANALTDPDKTNAVLAGETQELQYTVTLSTKGSYFVGLQSVVQVDDGTGTWEDVSESDVIGWSDDPTYAQGGTTFGIRFYPAPDAPTGIHPVS